MGRKRRLVDEPDLEKESPSRKKTKKEKHKKKKTKNETSATVKPLTLKIRLGNEVVTAAETSDTASVGEESMNTADVSSSSVAADTMKQNDWEGSDDVLSVGDDSYQTTHPDEVIDETEELEERGEEELDEEEDEEVWLVALETGNVDERGYVPQKKDPSVMTARQRAIFGSKEVELLELPLSSKRADGEETQEMLLKKTERNKKRRIQAIKRREKHKAETVQKLLQKQSRKKEDRKFDKSVVGPHLKYINSYDGISISLTEGLEYPIPTINNEFKLVAPSVIHCIICSTPKKYNDSITKLPICSLECYKKLRTK